MESMQVVITAGWHAGRRHAVADIVAAGYDPTGFLLRLALQGARWRIEGLTRQSAEVRQAWSLANLVALVGMSLHEGRTVRFGTRRWEADSGRFAEQLQEIEDAVVASGRYVFVLTEPGLPGEPGDLVIGLGDLE